MKNILTEKTKEAFEKWYFETHCKSSIKFEDLLLWQKAEVFDWLYSQSEIVQHAFLIEFFDSEGIDIDINLFRDVNENGSIVYFKAFVENEIVSFDYSFTYFLNRKEATSKALEKANEIFNNR